MSPLFLALVLATQAADGPAPSILSNDRPEFPIGLAKNMQTLEDVNQAAMKDPFGVPKFMEQTAKRGDLLAIPSGTKAKRLSVQKLRGPMFKDIVQVEITEGDQNGLRGWVCAESLVSDQSFAAITAAGERKKSEHPAYKPMYRDPIAGEKAYLTPQPTMFGMVRTLIRLAVADDSAWAVFREWQGATETSRDAVLKRLEMSKAIFFATVNTEVKVQKVFQDKVINGIYPVQVELLSGQFKGKVGWVPVTVVSPIPGTSSKTVRVAADAGKGEIQKTIEKRNQRRQIRAKQQAKAREEISVEVDKEREQQRRDAVVQSQVQLQMLQQQGAIAEARAANSRAAAYQQMSETLRFHQMMDAYRNGSGVIYGPNGTILMQETLRVPAPVIPE